MAKFWFFMIGPDRIIQSIIMYRPIDILLVVSGPTELSGY